MSTILVRRGTTTPTIAKLSNIGELALNYSNDTLYVRSNSLVIRVGGDLERVVYYETSLYYYELIYTFDPAYLYKIHILATTSGTTIDSSNTYFYYRDIDFNSLLGSYLSIISNDVASAITKTSARNTTTFTIQDAHSGGATLTSGITKVIDFELSPTLNPSTGTTTQWVGYGKSITSVMNQGNATITSVDFVHSIQGVFTSIYINPGLNIGPTDRFAITVYRMKRK